MEDFYAKISGKWNLIANTPFGKENYNLDILEDHNNCIFKIYNEKGFVNLFIKEVINNMIFLEGKTEFPIPCNLSASFQLVDSSNASGKICIDEYMTVDFIGVK